MAIRQILKEATDNDFLRKKSREVPQIDDRILQLLDDMKDTLYENNGVGLAAPQVGVLKRVVVIDVGNGLMELINPVIVKEEGEQIGAEGCLSIPGKSGTVKRPAEITVRALNRAGEEITVEGKELLAVALSHEIDHLDGVLYIDKVIAFVED